MLEFKEWTGRLNLPNIYKLQIVESRLVSSDMGRPVFPLNMLDVKLLPDNGELTIQTGSGKIGSYFTYTVKAVIPGLDLLFSRGITSALKTKWTLLVQDFHNTTYVLGPSARMQINGSLNKTKKGMEVSWTGIAEKIFTKDNHFMKNSPIDLRTYDYRDIIIYRGDTLKLDLEWPDENGDPEDLSDYSFSCKVKSALGVEVLSFSISNGFSLSDDNKKLVMEKSATATAALTPGIYYYDLQRTDADGIVETKLKGKFIIEGDIS